MGSRPVRACLITNPISGHGGIDLTPVLPVLAANGWDAVVREESREHSVHDLAARAVTDGHDVVVSCGGDGTLSDVVDAVVGSNVVVGTLRGGTGNLWTHEVGIAERLDHAALQLVGAQHRGVDVWRVTFNGRQHHFLLMAGFGFDGEVMARVSRSLENRLGHVAMVVAAVRALPSARGFPVHVELDGVRWQGDAHEILVGNSRVYRDFARLTPDALVDDGRLDVCIVTAQGPLALGRQLGSLLLRRRPSPASSIADRLAQVTVTSPTVLPMELDGSPIAQEDTAPEGEVAYSVSVVAQGVTMLLPRAYDGELFATGAVARPPFLSASVAPRAALRPESGGEGRRQVLRVVAVEVNRITAVRSSDGQSMAVVVDDSTEAEDAAGNRRPLSAFLDGLGEGALLRVVGTPGAQEGDTVRADRIRLLDPDRRED